MNDHCPGWHRLVVGRYHGITVAGNAVLHWQAPLALFSLGLAQRDSEHIRFAPAHGGHVDRDYTRTRIVLFKHNRAGGLREDNVRKRTARQARQFGLASTSEFAFETALTSPARNVVFGLIIERQSAQDQRLRFSVQFSSSVSGVLAFS
jgi:hypothetical protein